MRSSAVVSDVLSKIKFNRIHNKIHAKNDLRSRQVNITINPIM